jgi:leucyl-tRNA synthetase
VVTSCPSDAPDDYAALRDIQKKKEFREKFGIKEECVQGFDPIPIINTPTYGDMSAVKLCEDMKIVSQNDTVKLKEAKDIAYLKGFTEGVMTVGICKGEKVSDAKIKVRKYMIDNGMAVDYYEPAETVISRSGDECVDALCDQWSENYGEEKWKDQVLKFVTSKDFSAYTKPTLECFIDTLG